MDSQKRIEEQQAAFESTVQNQQQVLSNHSTPSQENVSGQHKYNKKTAATLFFIFGFPGYFYLHKWVMAIICLIFTCMGGVVGLIIGIVKGISTNAMSEEEFYRQYE